MKTIRIRRSLDIGIDLSGVAHALGYKDGGAPKRVLSIIDDISQKNELISSAAVYRFLSAEHLNSSFYLKGIEEVALCLVTIGPGVEDAAESAKNNGDLSRAIIIDSFGSAAAEACADEAEKLIAGECAARNLKCSRRFSPGYGGWDVAEQKWILKALKAGDIGVELSEGCMMVPRKSITFAVTVGADPVEMREAASQCEVCGLLNCRFRQFTR